MIVAGSGGMHASVASETTGLKSRKAHAYSGRAGARQVRGRYHKKR